MHVNGFVSLGFPPFPPYRAYNPRLCWNPNQCPYSVIAPFWTDIDLRWTDGVVYLGHFWRYSANQPVNKREAWVFKTVERLVQDSGFLPTEVITVTWLDVSPYPGWWYHTQVRTYAFDTM